MNPMIVDIVFVFFIIFMAILGYIKGFITRLYDVVTTIFVVFLSLWLSQPLSSVIKIYETHSNDPISLLLTPIINSCLVYVCVFVVLFVIKKIIGFVIKPALNKLFELFHMTEFLNHWLGVFLSMIESIIISYILILFLFIPIYPQGRTIIDSTIVTKNVLKVVPSVSYVITDATDHLDFSGSHELSKESLMKAILFSYEYHLMDEKQLLIIFDEHINEKLSGENIQLSLNEYQQLNELLNESHYTSREIENILSKMSVGDE